MSYLDEERRVFPIQRYGARDEFGASAEAMRNEGALGRIAYAIFEARMQCIHGIAGAGMVTIPGSERVRVLVMVEHSAVDAAAAEFVDQIDPYSSAVEVIARSAEVWR